MKSVGILGVGSHLPPTVRTNEFWSRETVDKWRRVQALQAAKLRAVPRDALTEGQRETIDAMMACGDDPFEGARERRVLDEGLDAADMEIAAAREAIADAGLAPTDIDAVLVYSVTPRYIQAPNACLVHRALGMRPDCMSLDTGGTCNAFLMQLALADAYVKAGAARHVLVVQSCLTSCLIDPQAPYAPWFGDGAAAAVVGEVGAGLGVLAHEHLSYGEGYGAIAVSVPGKRWFDDGRSTLHVVDPVAAQKQFLSVGDAVPSLVGRALEKAGLARHEVAFWACHQGTAWIARFGQRIAGLEHARQVETFSWTGSLSAANIPLALAIAKREGLLSRGDVVSMFAGGAGMTAASVVLRWGR